MIIQAQINPTTIRNKPISASLYTVLEKASRETGWDVEIFSGGQDPKGKKNARRTGSTRHDNGNAADLCLFKMVGVKKVYADMTERDGQTVMAKFVNICVRAGARGVGAHPNYMGPKAMHIGYGGAGVWGDTVALARGGRPAPDWLRKAWQAGMKGVAI